MAPRSSASLLACLLLTLLLAACGDRSANAPANRPKSAPAPAAGCRRCHPVELDPAHDIGCATCHQGHEEAATREEAHAGLIAQPAHPDFMAKTCGRCHAELVARAARSLHFTVKKEVNEVRRAFGAKRDLASLVEIPVKDRPDTVLALADDLLRRRCLRCHVYTKGDPYPETRRGTGCAACHLEYGNGAMRSHRFTGPVADGQCLHCHYANTVGADYYGRYEHDFHSDYRTPYPPVGKKPPPYGVEYHQLVPDVHQQAGLACTDCHPGAALMGPAHGTGSPGVSCETCHRWRPGQTRGLKLAESGGRVLLTLGRSGKEIPVPQMTSPVHAAYAGKATCVLCHAQWSYTDQGTHLMRQDTQNYDPWTYLVTQSCYEVEALLNASLFGGESREPRMTDKITGLSKPGIWFKGYELRRWEEPLICPDGEGRLTICRPVLDLHLSYVDPDGNVVFDSVPAKGPVGGALPYTPHTIGKAGAFFRERLQERTDIRWKQCPTEPRQGK
ncbi:MAG: hypothetical protein M0017_00180 [Desulfobacteraceae bacterium]|nr:hypothetical protein [Desulfobacteraceae bacterium]